MSALAGTVANKVANAVIVAAVIKKCRISISLKFMLCMLQVAYLVTRLQCVYIFTIWHII